MKVIHPASSLILTLAFIAHLSVSAQTDDVTNIFDDLSEFDPVPVAPQPAPKPVIAMPQAAPENAVSILQPPVQASPVLYTMDAGGGTYTPAVNEEPPVELLNIEETLSRGKEAYSDDDWNAAQKMFEAVLYDDPYNKTAIRWLERIADKKAGRELKNYNTTRTRMLENVQAAWNTPKAEGQSAGDAEIVRDPTADELRAEALRDKLDSIRIPAIAFQDANIQQVVLELSALCRTLDPERKGANLVVFGTAETLLPPVTFSGADLSALETLDIITQMSGMKYDIGPNMVSLTPVNYESPQQMVATEFDILSSVGSKMAIMSENQAGRSGLLDVREFFSGVPFPPGASAQYNPEFNVLLVRNVPKHLDKVAGLIKHYNRKALEERSQQVEIETKFIEVAEGALEELGFKWTIGESGELVNNDTIALAGGNNLLTENFSSAETAFSSAIASAGRATSFNSYGQPATASLTDGLVGPASELLLKKVTGTPAQLLIRALERSAGSDLLSAPKVLTKSGETATIHVGEVHWFPTAYDVTIERYSQPSLVPLDYEEEKTGVMLEVTPELDAENGTIDMKLAPEIRELAGFDEQHVSTLWPFFSAGGSSANAFDITTETLTGIDLESLLGNEQGAADRLIARRPVFKTRKINTTVTIEDGSTIVMGGLIKEKLETFKDSVPILGKIPLLGRLFRSEGERSVKRNLMIFVTANQVDATGYKKSAE